MSARTPADDEHVVWLWVAGGLTGWLMVGVASAVVLGRGIRLADQRSPDSGERQIAAAAPPSSLRRATAVGAARAPARRRAVPLPPIGVALVAMAVLLETVAYVRRLTGADQPAEGLFSADAPYSVARLYVAGIFLAAACVAVAGATFTTTRRAWWLAVGSVAGAIATVKAGSTLHASAVGALTEAFGRNGALILSASMALAVVAGLGFLSRHERRDRRRVLGSLSIFAAASVGLSFVSGAVAGAYGKTSSWAAAATFLEESGEAIAGVAFLLAVLIGVAPRSVLPATWRLRRAADAHALDLGEHLPGRVVDVR